MSEEEKEAIALLLVFNLANNLHHISEEDFADIKKANRILINLIEKQQKELEQEKEKNNKEQKRIYNVGYRNGCNDTSKWNDKNYISKDKIRAKIEELNKRIENLKQMQDSCAKTIGIEDCQEKIELYRELLEE